MIQEFSIENTFSIKNRQTISFEAVGDTDDELHCIDINGTKLLKLAGIYGANAAGKSNILKAFNYYIWFILNAFSHLKPDGGTGLVPFVFDKTLFKYGSFEITFYINSVRYQYSLVLNTVRVISESLIYDNLGNTEIIFTRKSIENDPRVGIYNWFFGNSIYIASIEIPQKMTRPNTTFLNTAAQLNINFLKDIYQYFSEMYMDLVVPFDQKLYIYTADQLEKDEKSKKEIVSLLKIADLGINDVYLEEILVSNENLIPLKNYSKDNKSMAISFLHDYNNFKIQIPYQLESRGTQRLFELAGPLVELIHGNKFLLIDEIESSLHDDLLEFFISTFLKNNSHSQLLFTTHNQDLLDSKLLRDDEIWFVQKGEDGGSEFYSLTDFEGVKQGISRRKLYKAGKFGALPIISDWNGGV
jgi:AAA15 family ATPase/GTPase